MRALFVLGAAAAVAVACGGSVSGIDDKPASGTSSGTSGSSGSSGTSGFSGTSSGSSGASGSSGTSGTNPLVLREPKVHRPAPVACTPGRNSNPPNVPDAGPNTGGYIECHSHAECTDGVNGRCTGNGHDGWRCTYDQCQNDKDCGSGVCSCEGGFRSDANVCLPASGCAVDADCGTNGWCSPTLGSCGTYGSTASWECHRAEDECTDDADCADAGTSYGGPFVGAGYCAYDSAAGHWKCSTSQCAG